MEVARSNPPTARAADVGRPVTENCAFCSALPCSSLLSSRLLLFAQRRRAHCAVANETDAARLARAPATPPPATPPPALDYTPHKYYIHAAVFAVVMCVIILRDCRHEF